MENIREISNVGRVENAEDTLEVLKVIGRLIGESFGKSCEVAISDIDSPNKNVIWIINGEVTSRYIGSPITKEAESRLSEYEAGYHLNYSKTAKIRNKEIKASTVIFSIKGHRYSFCINCDVTLERQVSNALQAYLSIDNKGYDGTVKYYDDPNVDIIAEVLDRELIELGKSPKGLTRAERKLLIKNIYKLGLFQRHKSVPIVADILGVSRYTIYNDIKAINKED